MNDLRTDRLVLHPLSAQEAGRVVQGHPEPDGQWAPDYPLADELDPLRDLIEQESAHEYPFTLFQIRNAESGQAIGGIGFPRQPDDAGSVEIGYGLVPSARGCGLATEALLAMVSLAGKTAASRMTAQTELSNRASRRVLTKAGFMVVGRTDSTLFYSRPLHVR